MTAARFADLAAATVAVAGTTKRNEKVAVLADVLRRVAPGEVATAVAYLVGETPFGRIGVGWATVGAVDAVPATDPSLTVPEVTRVIAELGRAAGSGSVAERRRLLHDLLGRATVDEQRLLRSILGGELRQGALDGVLAAAVAQAAGVPVAAVQRGAMMAGSLPTAAEVALRDGLAGLEAIDLAPLTPVLPMLASPAADVASALAETGEASVEWKLDGARIQAHRCGGDIALYTRNLNDVTARLPRVVELVRSLPGGDLVLDGEVLGVDADTGAPRRFQDTMGDFGAHDAGRGGGLDVFVFDILHAGGTSLVDEPLAVRRSALVELVPASARLPSIVTADPAEAERFLDAAVAAGHEGVMVKALESPYDAGRRGGAWRKIKPVHTFDLVVLAVEWGHGRRRGWLSNLHLGARGPDGTFVMVGKTFKGLTDELLRWQTERFLGLALGDDGHVVHVRPEQVVEVALDGVQRSSRYPGGVALRFARVRRYRDDKPASEADTIERVQALAHRP